MKTINKPELITTRDYLPEDRNFILATWLRGLYYGDTWFSKIPKPIFMEQYHGALERLLKLENLHVRVSCLREDPSVILGYAVYRDLAIQGKHVRVIDWMFVKSSWRKIGISKDLFDTATKACTHLTKAGEHLMKKYEIPLIFNPFLLNHS